MKRALVLIAMAATPSAVQLRDGKVVLPFALPRQGVSLVRLTW
jgi:hypothetical protein